MKAIKFPKIGQFRNLSKDISIMTAYKGKDENGKAIYDSGAINPTLRVKGTIKLHGTNASVCFDNVDGYRPQSRERVISIEKDNMGFAVFAEKNKEHFMNHINRYVKFFDIDLTKNTVVIYGEWAGIGVQKGVGISKVPKQFYCFGVRIKPIVDIEYEDGNLEENNHPSLWLDGSDIIDNDNGIYSIHQFQTFEMDIDFSHPQKSQNELIAITDEVERLCPVANHFKDEDGNPIEGIGEGVVWTTTYMGKVLRIKVKGEKHSVSKVKTVASVDPTLMKSVDEFVDMTVTENRVNQARQTVDGCDGTNKYLGQIIKWVHKDIIDEETDTLIASGLIWKDVASRVTRKIKEIYSNLPF